MFYPELKGPALEAHKAMKTKLKNTAMKELGLSENEIVVRDLRPEDYGSGSADAYAGITAASWETFVDAATIEDSRFIGISGVFSGGTANNSEGDNPFSQVRITRKGSVSRYWPMKEVQNFKHKIGYADDPITVDQNTAITIDVWGRTAGSIPNWGLVGAVAEKKGLLINP